MFVAHAAPATPSAGRWRPRTGRSSPKMKSGSRIRFAPNPTIMQTIELTAFPSARIIADSPKARWLNTIGNTTIRR